MSTIKYVLCTCLLLCTQPELFAHSLISKICEKLYKFNHKNRNTIREVCNNVYEVEKGALYRSQQLSEKELTHYIKKFDIKTLINLRGKDKRSLWVREKNTADELGVLFFSLSMSAIYLTSKEDLLALLTIYHTAPRPMLVHCIGGADRTGEASALWVLEMRKKSKSEAMEQLSIKYGHRKYKNSAKDFLISIWQGQDWLIKTYNPCDYPAYCKPILHK